jgi:hypothetical protein
MHLAPGQESHENGEVNRIVITRSFEPSRRSPSTWQKPLIRPPDSHRHKVASGHFCVWIIPRIRQIL